VGLFYNIFAVAKLILSAILSFLFWLLIWGLLIVVLTALGFAFWELYIIVQFPDVIPDDFHKLNLVPAISISAGVLIAIVTFFRDRQRNISKVFLERAIVSFEDVVKILSGHNNNRVDWVHAARTLLNAQEIGAQIKFPEYKKAYQLEVNRTRADLHRVLETEDPKTGYPSPLPPAFFYGSENWKEQWKNNTKQGVLAIKVSQEIGAYEAEIHKLPPPCDLSSLSDKSIVTIYDFLLYPKGFPDLVRKVKVWDYPWHSPFHIERQGAQRYIGFNKKYKAVGKKLYKRGGDTDVEIQPDDAN
jgi:hypothetical protein